MGAGAVTLGLGAALVSGAGVAHAESADADGASKSSPNSNDDSSSGQAQSDGSDQDPSAADDDSAADTKPQESSQSADDDADPDAEDSDAESEEPAASIDGDDDDSGPELDTAPTEDTETEALETASPPPAVVETTVSATSSGITTSPTSDTDTPVEASALLTLTGAARRDTAEIEATAVLPIEQTAGPTADISAGAAPDTAISANADSHAEADKEAADAQFNLSVGWIPGLGTVYNGLSLFSDLAEFSSALAAGDSADIVDEIGDIAVDVIGMVPVVGGPLAATIHQLRAAASGPPNDAPVAGEDVYTTDEDAPLTGNVLTNDTDTEGAPLTAAVRTQPAHGAVTVNADGSFTYTSTTNYNGVDVFTYTVSDGVKSTTGTVTITVNPVSDAPVAGGDSGTVNEDNSTVIALLGNDSDADGDQLSVVEVTGAGHGAVVLGDDGTVTYTPDANYHGTDTFSYTVTDGQGGTSIATVSLIVTSVNDAPVVPPGDYTVDEDTPLTGNVLTGATDADGDSLTAAIGTGPTHGTVELNADGSFTFTPAAEYSGADEFTYTVTDGATTTTATVSLLVNAVNDAPTVGDDTATLDEDTSVGISVLGDDSDIDGGSLSVIGVGAPGHGTASVNEDGTITYTAAANYNGTDSFTYTVADGQGGTTTATVTLVINPVGDTPIAQGDNFGVDQDKPLTGNVLGNDYDPDGDSLTVGVISGPAHGSLTLNPDGSFTYNPAGGFHGADSFSYTLTDSTGASTSATASITVNYVAPPVSNELGAGQWLEVGKYLQSNNGRYRVYMQGDGNLVMYDEAQNHKALWATGTNGQPGLRAVMQGDGNLVLYAGSTGKWSSKTSGWNGARLVVQDDGNLVIYSGSTAVWDRRAGVLKNPPGPGGSSLGKPLTAYTVTQRYGGAHTGIDLAAPSGTPVYAAADGVIYFEGWGTTAAPGAPRSNWMGNSAGISIIVQHDSLGIYTGYAHLSDTVINQGQYVTKGQLIGHVGCTTRTQGGCTGPHLHFEVLAKPLNSGVGISGRINPAPYITL